MRSDEVKEGIGLAAWLAIITVGIVAMTAVLSLGWAKFVDRPLRDLDAENRRAGYEAQDTARDLLARKISEFEGAQTDAHRAALRAEACRIADGIRGTLDGHAAVWTSANCS